MELHYLASVTVVCRHCDRGAAGGRTVEQGSCVCVADGLASRFCRKFPQWMRGTKEIRLAYSATEWNRWAGQSSRVSSNWPFRIMCISSIPVSVTAADQKDLNPNIGRTNRLMAR